MSMAVKYAMMKRAKKECDEMMAKGGFVDEEEQSGYGMMPKANKMNHPAEMTDEDIVSSIMRKRYSKGGRVANDTDDMSTDMEPNEFDDLVKDDHLDFHETGANSGDELGDAHLDEEDRDLISQIMRKRARKDHNPRPA